MKIRKLVPIILMAMMLLPAFLSFFPSDEQPVASHTSWIPPANTWIWQSNSSSTWNTAASWCGSGGHTVPATGAIVIFNGTGTGACSINVDTAVLQNFSVNAGYTSTITNAASCDVTTTSDITISSGTVTSVTSAVWTCGGNFVSTSTLTTNVFRLIMTGSGTTATITTTSVIYSFQASNDVTFTYGASAPYFIFLTVDSGKTLIIASGKTFAWNAYIAGAILSNLGVMAGTGSFLYQARGMSLVTNFGVINCPITISNKATAGANADTTLGADTVFGSTLSVLSAHATYTMSLLAGASNYQLQVAGTTTLGARGVMTQGTGTWAFNGGLTVSGTSALLTQGGTIYVNGSAVTLTTGTITGDSSHWIIDSQNWAGVTGTKTANTIRLKMTGVGKTLTTGSSAFRDVYIDTGASVTLGSNLHIKYNLTRVGTLSKSTYDIYFYSSPVFATSPGLTAVPTVAYKYNVTCNQIATLSIYAQTHAWLTAVGGNATGTPGGGDIGANVISLRLNNGNYSGWQNFTITVTFWNTWSGLGANNLASTAANWENGSLVNGSYLVFTDLSSKNCTFDVEGSYAAFIMRGLCYANVTMEKNITSNLTVIASYNNLMSDWTLWSDPNLTWTQRGDFYHYSGFIPTHIFNFIWDANCTFTQGYRTYQGMERYLMGAYAWASNRWTITSGHELRYFAGIDSSGLAWNPPDGDGGGVVNLTIEPNAILTIVPPTWATMSLYYPLIFPLGLTDYAGTPYYCESNFTNLGLIRMEPPAGTSPMEFIAFDGLLTTGDLSVTLGNITCPLGFNNIYGGNWTIIANYPTGDITLFGWNDSGWGQPNYIQGNHDWIINGSFDIGYIFGTTINFYGNAGYYLNVSGTLTAIYDFYQLGPVICQNLDTSIGNLTSSALIEMIGTGTIQTNGTAAGGPYDFHIHGNLTLYSDVWVDHWFNDTGAAITFNGWHIYYNGTMLPIVPHIFISTPILTIFAFYLYSYTPVTSDNATIISMTSTAGWLILFNGTITGIPTDLDIGIYYVNITSVAANATVYQNYTLIVYQNTDSNMLLISLIFGFGMIGLAVVTRMKPLVMLSGVTWIYCGMTVFVLFSDFFMIAGIGLGMILFIYGGITLNEDEKEK